MLGVPATVTIDEAFEAFLADQRERLSPKTLRNYEDVQGYIADEQRKTATDRGADAARDLPSADRLGSLLHDEMEKTPRFDVDDIPEEHWIEDFLAIERAEPGSCGSKGESDQLPYRRRRRISRKSTGA
jgi:hypothetical protein